MLGGIHSEYQQYNVLKQDQEKLLSEISFLEGEISLYKKQLSRLGYMEKEMFDLNMSKLASFNDTLFFISPIDGIISDIFYEANEICYKKEELMSIHQINNATITTYFDLSEVANIKIGDQVDISFPDGSIRKGLIGKFYTSTYALPAEFQKKYEPTERNIVAQVIPLDKKEEQSWRNFYKMDVKIKKKRYQLFNKIRDLAML